VTWDAIVLAGSRPGSDPFARAYGTDLKPLIPVGGVPMVTRPVEALLAAPQIGQARVLTQHRDRIAAAIPADGRLSVEQSGTTIAGTLAAIFADPSTRYPLLVTTADHALLDPAMIADFCAKAEGADLAIGLVERAKLMSRLPGTSRSWLKFRGGAYSGANLFALGSAKAAAAVELWRSVEQDRKKGWRMIAALGPLALLGAALRLRTLDQTLDAVGRRLGLTIRKVELADPLAAVDVDKPSDHELVTAILEGRA
jgi:GTP:adenosylcobinamide-phosphate guanylyltransferase